MSNKYMDLVVLTNGSVCRAPGFSDIQPGSIVAALGGIYDVLDAVPRLESEALLTLPKAYGVIHPLEYNEDKQEDMENV